MELEKINSFSAEQNEFPKEFGKNVSFFTERTIFWNKLFKNDSFLLIDQFFRKKTVVCLNE